MQEINDEMYDNRDIIQMTESYPMQSGETYQRSRSYGNYIILKRKQNGEPWLMVGPHWYIFMIAFLVCVGLYTLLLTSVRTQLSKFWFIALSISTVAFLLSYLAIGLSNPGFARPIKNITSSEEKSSRFCSKCRTMKGRDIFHCEDCDVCIDGYDHHCPWVGKCIGYNNVRLFYTFLLLTFGTLIICFIGTIASSSSNKKTHLRNGKPT